MLKFALFAIMILALHRAGYNAEKGNFAKAFISALEFGLMCYITNAVL